MATPLTGRSGATTTATVAAGRAATTATRTTCGRRRAFTTSTWTVGVSPVRTAAVPATPVRLAVFLNQG